MDALVCVTVGCDGKKEDNIPHVLSHERDDPSEFCDVCARMRCLL